MAGLIASSEVDDQNRLERIAPGGAATPDDAPEPGVIARTATFGKNVGTLGMQGFAQTARAVNLLGGAVPVLGEAVNNAANQVFRGSQPDDAGSHDIADAYFARNVAPLNDVVNYWSPDAKTTGWATNLVGGFLKLGTEAMSGGAASLIGSEQVGTSIDLVNKGVDAATANKVGAAVGVTNAFGLSFGGFGGGLPARIVSNFAGNAALSVATATTERAVLADAGFEKEAKAVDAFDPHARSLDMLTGLLMAATHRGAAVPKLSVAEGDAVLSAANANRVQTSSAPVAPATAAGQAAHVSAFDDAIAAVVRGEKVDVAATLNPADFQLDKPNPQAAPVVSAAKSKVILSNLSGTRAAVRDAAVTAGADPQTTLAIAKIESNFDPAAKNPNSTATGIGQFLDSTWKAMGGTDANRFDPATQARLLSELTVKNTDALREAIGREPQPQEVYLAHLLGLGGAKKVLRADPSVPIADVIGQKVAEGNGMKGMTVAQAVEHWKQKVENAGAEPVAQKNADQAQPAASIPATEAASTSASTTSGEAVRAGENGAESIAANDTLAAPEVNAKPITGLQADHETARQTADANPDLAIYDEQGVPMLARDAVAQGDAHLAEQDHFASAYEVAINCALRGGH